MNIDLFLNKIVLVNECWVWQGHKNKKGYGLTTSKISQLVHRVVYVLLVGPIPKGLQLDHLCRNTSCVNPAHLEPVTSRENTLRGHSMMAKRAQQTHCKNGHELIEMNVYRDKYGRHCKTCIIQRTQKYRGQKHAIPA